MCIYVFFAFHIVCNAFRIALLLKCSIQINLPWIALPLHLHHLRNNPTEAVVSSRIQFYKCKGTQLKWSTRLPRGQGIYKLVPEISFTMKCMLLNKCCIQTLQCYNIVTYRSWRTAAAFKSNTFGYGSGLSSPSRPLMSGGQPHFALVPHCAVQHTPSQGGTLCPVCSLDCSLWHRGNTICLIAAKWCAAQLPVLVDGNHSRLESAINMLLVKINESWVEPGSRATTLAKSMSHMILANEGMKRLSINESNFSHTLCCERKLRVQIWRTNHTS